MSRVSWSVRAIHALVGLVRSFITAGIVLVAGSVFLQLYLQQVWQPEAQGQRLSAPPTAIERIQVEQHRARLAAALEVYALQNGQFPLELSALVESGLVGERSLRYPSFSTPWFYRASGDDYELHPPLR